MLVSNNIHQAVTVQQRRFAAASDVHAPEEVPLGYKQVDELYISIREGLIVCRWSVAERLRFFQY
jgi:hypothetical protein